MRRRDMRSLRKTLSIRRRRHVRSRPNKTVLASRNISVLAKAAPKGEKTAGKKHQRRAVLTIKGKAYLAGIYEHPTRHAPDKSAAQLHAEVAKGALEDAG